MTTRFDTVFTNIRLVRATVDLPSIGSNGSEFSDVTVADTPLGTHLLSVTPLTDATSIDDLIVQAVIVAANTLRLTMFNPTAGAINPDSIDFEFLLAEANPTFPTS